MKQLSDRQCGPSRPAVAAQDRGTSLMISRRLLLVTLPAALAGCESMPTWLGGRPPREKLSPQAEKLVRWLQQEGRTSVLDPAAPRIMGLDNGQRDIPVKQLAADTQTGRHVVSLTSLRGRPELIFHRRQSDNLFFHLASANLVRQASATYPRNGAPGRMSDSYAENDYPLQAQYWTQQAALRTR